MKIEVSKLREFFRRTGKLEDVSWDENVLKPIKTKTVHPDERLDFNETFNHIHNERNRSYN